jgi:hypothetical protein
MNPRIFTVVVHCNFTGTYLDMAKDMPWEYWFAFPSVIVLRPHVAED